MEYHKFRYYSAHDSTLNALLNAFELIDCDNEVWPPFAADITIELWKQFDPEKNTHNSYFIKFFYCDKVLLKLTKKKNLNLINFYLNFIHFENQSPYRSAKNKINSTTRLIVNVI